MSDAVSVYESLVRSSERATQNAQRSESQWALKFWNGVADRLLDKALALPMSSVNDIENVYHDNVRFIL